MGLSTTQIIYLMKRSGSADMALWDGGIPAWLFQRMKKLALPMVETLLIEHGHQEFLRRLSNPFWFQSFGAVIGMDWNSSGITTAVMRALKEAINPHAPSLGLYVCGGKGKESRETPRELLRIGDATGLNGDQLARESKLTAKVDNTALQDGFQLYLHSFVVSEKGDWTVIQQGMQGRQGLARRYHWHSVGLESFTEEPHAAVCGKNRGPILNLTAKAALPTQAALLAISSESPEKILSEVPRMKLPDYCDLRASDINLQRLGGVLRLAQEQSTRTFDELLLLKGMGPRTLQSLTFISEVLHGTPSRFEDPARFAFAHGGKSGTPFPVPTRVYDESIQAMEESISRAKLGDQDKMKAIQKLSKLAARWEASDAPLPKLNTLLEEERSQSHKYGGRSIHGRAKDSSQGQLGLFDAS